MSVRYLLILITLVLYITKSQAQKDNHNKIDNVSVQATIIDQISRQIIMGAKVTIKEIGLETYTDQRGHFTFPPIPLRKFTMTIEHDNYITKELDILDYNSKKVLRYSLVPNSLKMDEVVVIGKKSNQNSSTSTLINRKAIEHLQATSLQEVLQLVPGTPISNPNFANTNQANIRQYGADNLGSLGTSIIINGSALSNNANLQTINTATAAGGASFSTSSGGGIDLRAINADNIESVEVIRGIPSVEYGDLNAGAIIVKTKARKEPLQLKARFNPQLTQFWGGKGYDLKNGNSIFIDLDHTLSNDEQTNKYRKYERTTSSIQYTGYIDRKRKWMTNSAFAYSNSRDTYDMDPDFVVDSIKNRSVENNFRFTTNGDIHFNKWHTRSLRYSVGVNYGIQKGYQQQYYTTSVSAESYALDNSTNEVPYLPSSYMNNTWIDGKPLNINASVTNQMYFVTGAFTHNIIIGSEWKSDANFGQGKKFTRPIRTSSNAAFRARPYNDIPSLNQLAFYLQDRLSGKIGKSKINVMAGLRWDDTQPLRSDYSMHALSPRLSGTLTLPNNTTFRIAYGITSKAPTLLYLYPENAYFDFYSLNYYATNPEERLAIISTRVYNTQNKNLKLSNTEKVEAGIDIDIDKKNRSKLSITGYWEHTQNGYSMSTTFDAIQFASYPTYTVASRPANSKPILSDVVTNKTNFVSYYAPGNDINRINKGIEFELGLGKLPLTNTLININGAYTFTRSVNNSPYILQQNVAGRETTRVGIFPAQRGREYSRLLTTLRAIQHIPELSFIVTFSAQTIWMDQNKYVGYDSLPIGYIPYNDGQTISPVYFNNEQRSKINNISDPDIFLSINKSNFIKESWRPLWLFNLKLTKEFKGGLNFSFYANNFINYRPMETSSRYPTIYEKRNISFFFGSEVSIRL